MPNGLDWTVSTSVYSTFYAFHCDDVRHRESLQSCYGICVTSLLYHSWPPFFIKYSSFLLWLVAFLLLLASWTPPSPFVPPPPRLGGGVWKKNKQNKAHKMGPFGVSGKGGLCCNKCFNKQLTVITPCRVWHQKKEKIRKKTNY